MMWECNQRWSPLLTMQTYTMQEFDPRPQGLSPTNCLLVCVALAGTLAIETYRLVQDVVGASSRKPASHLAASLASFERDPSTGRPERVSDQLVNSGHGRIDEPELVAFDRLYSSTSPLIQPAPRSGWGAAIRRPSPSSLHRTRPVRRRVRSCVLTHELPPIGNVETR